MAEPDWRDKGWWEGWSHASVNWQGGDVGGKMGMVETGQALTEALTDQPEGAG